MFWFSYSIETLRFFKNVLEVFLHNIKAFISTLKPVANSSTEIRIWSNIHFWWRATISSVTAELYENSSEGINSSKLYWWWWILLLIYFFFIIFIILEAPLVIIWILNDIFNCLSKNYINRFPQIQRKLTFMIRYDISEITWCLDMSTNNVSVTYIDVSVV